MMKPIRFLSVLMIVLVLCCGCQRTVNPEQKGNITLYQMADDGSKLQSSEYEIQADQEDNVAVIQELLDCFKKCVAIDNFQLKEKQLTITFLSSYYNQDKIDEVLNRAAIVKTLCQLSSVEYVEFYVGDNPLVIDGETVGIMSKLSFLDSVGGEGYTQEKYVTLYFSSNDGTKMQEITTKLTHDMTVPLARLLIEQLLKGPNEISDANTSDVRDTIPAGTKLNSLTIRDHVCYVDFSKEFMNMQADVSSGVVVYSIVNTLCELSDVNKVQFTIDGEQQNMLSPANSIKKGMVLISEDRRGKALVGNLSIKENVLLSCIDRYAKHGYLDEKKEKQDVSEKAEALKIRMTGLDQRIIELSGGNQQKAVFAKALMTDPKVFLCDEPTQAVDIMTRNEIHKLLREKADAGNAVVYVSSDLKEILEVADTIQLVVQGETRQLLVNENLTTTEVLSYCYE